MNKLSERQKRIYQRILKTARIYIEAEENFVEDLIEAEECRLHKALGLRSIFKFAVEKLNLTDPVALMLIGVARAAKNFPEIRSAIKEKRITPAKVSRFVAHLDKANASELIEYAISHTYREIAFEMARRNPSLDVKESAKPISEDTMLIKSKMTMTGYKNLQRVQSLEAQKGKDYEIGAAIQAALEVYLYKNDPIEKAKRSKLCADRPEEGRPSQAKRNAALARDGGQCTQHDENGVRCDCHRWVEVHHIVKLSEGGSNDLENLTTLCWHHHDLIHQLDFPIH